MICMWTRTIYIDETVAAEAQAKWKLIIELYVSDYRQASDLCRTFLFLGFPAHIMIPIALYAFILAIQNAMALSLSLQNE